MTNYRVTFTIKKPSELKVADFKEWIRSEIGRGGLSWGNPMEFACINSHTVDIKITKVKEKR